MTEHVIKWRDRSNIIPEENIIIAAGLRDRLRMTPAQISDFLENFLNLEGARDRADAVKVTLAHARGHEIRPYDKARSIEDESPEEELCFRLIEERTGLMVPDIVALYGLNTPNHRKYVDRWYSRESWTREKLTVLGGLIVYCCNGDKNAAMSYMLRWLGRQGQERYANAYAVVARLKKSHRFFREYIEVGEHDSIQRQEFETLLRSKPETKDWTINTLASEYRNRARVEWSNSDNQLLWAGLIRYCNLSGREAVQFLEMWFGREFPRYGPFRQFSLPYSAISYAGKRVQDVAPINLPLAAGRMDAFSKLLAQKGWTIKSVKDAAERGDFSLEVSQRTTN